MMTHTILVILFTVALVPGLLMAFVPMLPAFWFLFTITVVFAFLDGFQHLTGENLTILAGIFGLSVLVDWSAGLLGAKFGGAAWKSLLCGMAGGIIGVFFFPPLGIFIGLFTGVLVGELIRHKDTARAVKAASGALVGSLTGVAINVLLAIAFVVLFIVFAIS